MRRHASAIFKSGGSRIDQPVPPEFQLCARCERQQGDYRSVAPTPIATEEQLAAWTTYLARWTLEYPVKLRLVPVFCQHPDGGPMLRIIFDYYEEKNARNPAEAAPRAIGIFPPSLLPDENTPRWIRANILYHLNHELDEWLKLDGQHVFDPHHQSHYECDNCIVVDDKRGAGLS